MSGAVDLHAKLAEPKEPFDPRIVAMPSTRDAGGELPKPGRPV